MQQIVDTAQFECVWPVDGQKEDDQKAEDRSTDEVEFHGHVVRTITLQLNANECMQKLAFVGRFAF